ncbi:MAG: threonine synthase [Candidatus Aminicenantes bacterium]|nr:threonine synthase [Candidatus Aminicenantes bacterium]
MENVKGYKCIKCGTEFNLDDIAYICEKCKGNLQIIYDYQFIKKKLKKSDFAENTDYSIWRYKDLLPVKDLSKKPVVHIGWTPLYKADKSGAHLGLKNLYIKDDGRNPSASLKDRPGAIAVVKALERDEKAITCASTGNAASSLACLTAALGLKTIIFVPEAAPSAKIAQLLVFGAFVIAVKGSYDDAFDLSVKATEKYGWYSRNSGYNSYTREGKKTCSYEICEQLGWECPDKIFVPVGDGNLISGMWKGFVDLYELGFIDRLPQLISCQAENMDAINRAFESDGVIRPVKGKTVADSISVSFPHDGDAALKAIKESGGFAVSVSDEQIIHAIPELARETSVFGEPSGVTPFAALQRAVCTNKIRDNEKIIIMMSGNGLKDINSAMKSVKGPLTMRPDLKELEKIISKGLV